MPLLAIVLRGIPVIRGPLLCSSSGWAHAFRASGPKIVYCHNPARWLYQPEDYFAALPRWLLPVVTALLVPWRTWDQRQSRTVDLYLANSSGTAARIRKAYGVEATVLHPPAGLDPTGARQPVDGLLPGYFLTVGRSRGYKNTQHIAQAVAATPAARLVAVGADPCLQDLSPERIRCLSHLSDDELRWLYANAKAVIATGHEDFGLTPVEGFSLGTCCIALRAGGYLETCTEGVTGTFVETGEADELAKVLDSFDPLRYDPEMLAAHAEQFTHRRFVERLRDVVAEEIDKAERGPAFKGGGSDARSRRRFGPLDGERRSRRHDNPKEPRLPHLLSYPAGRRTGRRPWDGLPT